MKGSILKRSFAAKIIVVFVCAVLLPMLLVSFLIFYHSKMTLQNNTDDYLKNLASVTMSKVQDSIDDVENIAFYISANEVVQRNTEKDNKELSRIAKYERYSETRDVLSYYVLLKPEITSVYIKSVHDDVYSYSKSRYYIDYTRVLARPNAQENSWKLEDDSLFLVRNVNAYVDKEPIGKMAMEVDASVFYDIIKDIDHSEKGVVYLIDSHNNIVAGQHASMTGQELPEVYQKAINAKDDLNYHVDIEGADYSVYTGQSLDNGWRLVLSIPSDYYMGDVMRLQNQVLLALAIAGIAVILLIIFLTKNITRPIKNLSDAMEEVGQGNLDTICAATGEDEIGKLGQTFNQMVVDMRSLINSEYEQRVMKQGAEMKSLQMQINPHFLYNTLDTINWMARIEGNDDVGDMTSALGSLMRYSLSKKEFVTIREEIENLKHYVEIQDVRYGDKMSVQFEVAEDVVEYYIPKLLIQPILENAIVHGVEDKLEPALIKVRIYHEEKELFMVVEDDGVGMTLEAIQNILSDDPKTRKNHTSIGVNNVNRRIQMVFGKEYGLQIQSELGAGTKITLRLRTLEQPPEMILKYND